MLEGSVNAKEAACEQQLYLWSNRADCSTGTSVRILWEKVSVQNFPWTWMIQKSPSLTRWSLPVTWNVCQLHPEVAALKNLDQPQPLEQIHATTPCLVPGDQQINKNWNRIPPWEFFSYDHHVGPYSATAKLIRITNFQAIPGTNHQSTRNWSLHQFCSKNLLQLLILLQFCFMAKLPKTEVCSNFQRPKSALHNLDMLIQDILKAGRWP